LNKWSKEKEERIDANDRERDVYVQVDKKKQRTAHAYEEHNKNSSRQNHNRGGLENATERRRIKDSEGSIRGGLFGF
jgi:hypothetical protein